jgi:hypothetical protein
LAGDFLPAGFLAAPFTAELSTVVSLSDFFLGAGFSETGFFAAAASLFVAFFATGGFAAAVLAAGVFAAGFFEVGALGSGVSPIESTESELFFFTISGALQAVSLSGHTHRFETLNLCQPLL